MTHFFDIATSDLTNTFNFSIGEEREIGVWNSGGPSLTVKPDDPNVAIVTAQIPMDTWWFKVRVMGMGNGNSQLRAKNILGQQWATTQAVVWPTPAATPNKTGGMESTLDLSKLGPHYNADLTITLKLCLQQGATTGTVNDSDSVAFPVEAWKAQEWTAFKQSFQRMGQSFWDGKFWLKTPVRYSPLVKSGYRHNVYCRFKLELVDTAAAANKTIQVVKLKVPAGIHYGASTFRSNDSLYDNFDLGWASYVRSGKTYTQRTFIHEIGHALGLPHSAVSSGDATCAANANKNSDVCYGVSASDRTDIMGFGHKLSARDGLPWQKRMELHTGIAASEWTASTIHLPPVRA